MDADGKLNEDEMAVVERHLERWHFFEKPCPCCGAETDDWAQGTHILVIHAPKGIWPDITIAGQTVCCPVVLITCAICGYTHLFSAICLGLFDEEGKPKCLTTNYKSGVSNE